MGFTLLPSTIFICPLVITFSPAAKPSNISTWSPIILPAITFLFLPYCLSSTNTWLLLTLPTNALLGTINYRAWLGKSKMAVPYIPAFNWFPAFDISISTGKFKAASAFAAIKLTRPVKFLSGNTLAFTSTAITNFQLSNLVLIYINSQFQF